MPKLATPSPYSSMTYTEVPELQDVQGQKRMAPPLQPKRLGQISSFFGERPLMGIY